MADVEPAYTRLEDRKNSLNMVSLSLEDDNPVDPKQFVCNSDLWREARENTEGIPQPMKINANDMTDNSVGASLFDDKHQLPNSMLSGDDEVIEEEETDISGHEVHQPSRKIQNKMWLRALILIVISYGIIATLYNFM